MQFLRLIHKMLRSFLSTVRPDASINSAVNAALISLSVRPDASINSAVNAALISLSVRPELVEGNERIMHLINALIFSNLD